MNWRNEKYRRLVADLPCINCGVIGQSQAAHANSLRFGKARAMKSHDFCTFPLCHVGARCCHDQHDRHCADMRKIERIDYEAILIAQTIMTLYRATFDEDISVNAFDLVTCQTVAEAIVSKYTLKQLRAA